MTTHVYSGPTALLVAINHLTAEQRDEVFVIDIYKDPGDTFSTLSTYDLIRAHSGIEFLLRVNGTCSVSTLLLAAAVPDTHRLLSPNVIFSFSPITGMMQGTFKDLKIATEMMELTRSRVYGIIMANFAVSDEDLKRMLATEAVLPAGIVAKMGFTPWVTPSGGKLPSIDPAKESLGTGTGWDAGNMPEWTGHGPKQRELIDIDGPGFGLGHPSYGTRAKGALDEA